MFLELFFSSPIVGLVWILAILFSFTIHEFSHALVGKICGDGTAEREGRLTLNPFAHIDMIGFGLILLFGFGWAKPVPFNPYNLKNPKWDAVKIAVAGPISNLVIAAVAALTLRTLNGMQWVAELNLLSVFLLLTVLLNLLLAFFNIIPVYPLDGSKFFFAVFDGPQYARLRNFVAYYGSQILMAAVLLSAFTSLNIFFFVHQPAFVLCQALVGTSCTNYLVQIFSVL